MTVSPSTSREPPAQRRLREFVAWLGAGRALTQTGRIRLADARELVVRLDTADELDPMGGRFKTQSSAELPGLSLVVAWATACRLVRASRGRLVPVKKSAVLLDRPDQLWDRMLEVFGLLGEELCPGGWSHSLMRDHFPEVVDAVFDVVRERRERREPLAEGELCALAWELVSARYHLEELTERQLATARALNDRDLRGMLATLEQLGALDRDGDAVTLSERAATGVRRVRGEVGPTDAVLQIKISLLGVSKPPVWRRLLVPAGIRLDRFHHVVQQAMGWSDSHLHVFSTGAAEYGFADPELGHRDERKTTLDRLLVREGDRLRYTYDFGDDWEHDIALEKLLHAEPGQRCPVCVAGRGACPPEDCGGPWGYANLRAALADPDHDEHGEMLEWLGLAKAADFDFAAFDVAEVDAALG